MKTEIDAHLWNRAKISCYEYVVDQWIAGNDQPHIIAAVVAYTNPSTLSSVMAAYDYFRRI